MTVEQQTYTPDQIPKTLTITIAGDDTEDIERQAQLIMSLLATNIPNVHSANGQWHIAYNPNPWLRARLITDFKATWTDTP